MGSGFFSAGGPHTPHIRYEGDNEEILVVWGEIFGSVKEVMKFTDNLQPPQNPKHLYCAQVRHDVDKRFRWYRACHEFAAKTHPYPTGEAIEDVRWRAAICDLAVLQNGRYDRAGPDYREHYLAFCETVGLGIRKSISSVPDDSQQERRRLIENSNDITALGMNFCLTDNDFL